MLPEPLTPADCDLTAYPTMPFNVKRFTTSTILFEVSGDAFKAALLLWCEAWHQVPAASLPDDDRHLAKAAGYGFAVDAWRMIREQALYGFIKCADGRLYHPVVAEMALNSWDKRKKFLERSQKANGAKVQQGTQTGTLKEKIAEPKRNEKDGLKDDLKGPKNAGSEVKGSEGKGSKESSSVDDDIFSGDFAPPLPPIIPKPKPEKPKPPEGDFKAWYAAYPKKVAPTKAEESYRKALARGATHDGLMIALAAHLELWALRGGRAFVPDPPHPTTYLNQERYLDDTAKEIENVQRINSPQPNGHDPRLAQRNERNGAMLTGLAKNFNRS